MGDIGLGVARILIDQSGDPITDDSSNALKVKLVGSDTINANIGDVDMEFAGVAASVNNGAADTGTLRVTIASDTTGVLSVDDNGSTLSIDDGGGVITVDGTVTANLSSTDNTVLDNILTKNTEIDAVLDTIKVDTEAIETAVELLDNAISGSEMQVDVVAALPGGTNAIGKVGHDITGGADGVTTVSTAGTHVVLASSTACKKVDIQAQTDNTGLIAVGFDAVDATEATGTGVILYAGDIYSLEIDNLNLIYIDSTVSGEGVRYTYFT